MSLDGSQKCHTCGESFSTAQRQQRMQSPFATTILRQNACIDSSQYAAVRKIVLEADTRLASLASKIKAAEALLRSLRNEEADLESFRDNHARIIHPIHRLPPEIMGEIFTNCLPLEDDSDEIISKFLCDRDSMPMILTTITSRWRNLAIALPSLWSTMSIFLEHVRLRNQKRTPSQLVSLWLRRSAQQPLTLRVFCNSSYKYGEEESYQSILQSLVEESHRWKIILLPAKLFRDSHFKLDPIQGRLPLLEELSAGYESQWHADNPEEVEANMYTADIFKVAPKLSTVTLHDLTHNIPLPYAQITVLCCQFTFQSDSIIETFAKFPNLQVLVLYTLSFDPPSSSLLPPSFLPPMHKELWRLNVSNIFQFFHTLDRVTIPTLAHLLLSGEVVEETDDDADDAEEPPTDSWLQSSMMTFLARSQCDLVQLSLKGAPILGADLIEILGFLPYLDGLTVDMTAFDHWLSQDKERGINDDVIRALTHKVYDGTAYCSDLATVVFRGNFILDSKCIFDMLSSRQLLDPALIFEPFEFYPLLSVCFPTPTNFVADESWEQLRETGLMIDFY